MSLSNKGLVFGLLPRFRINGDRHYLNKKIMMLLKGRKKSKYFSLKPLMGI